MALVVLAVAGGVAAGGLVKGATGLGLPLVAVPIMALAIDVPTAVAIMPMPIIAANLWQSLRRTDLRATIRRFWPLMATIPVGAVIGVAVLASVDPLALGGVLGGIVMVFCLTSLTRFDWRLPKPAERWLAPIVGLISGTTGGMSSFYGPPTAIYLLTLRLAPREFICVVGVNHLLGGISMLVLLPGFGLLEGMDFAWTALAVAPVLAGVWLGQILRDRLDAGKFRRAVLIVLLVIGVNLVRRAIFA
jgi:hypothetical protein